MYGVLGVLSKVSSVPSWEMEPLSRTKMYSAPCMTSCMSWDTTRMGGMVSEKIYFRSMFFDCASSAEKGSSSRRKSGWMMRARAMATRCFSPPESWFG